MKSNSNVIYWFINKKFIFISLLFVFFSCSSKMEKIEKFPKEYRGNWIDRYKEFKLIIRKEKIHRIDISYKEPDTIKNEVTALYKVGRGDCKDCLGYRIKVKYKRGLERFDYLFLNTYHPQFDNYIVLKQTESYIDPYDNSRKFSDPKSWKRIIK